jgi:hypothetical protein
MACIASTFTGSVAALKASKVLVRVAPRERARTRRAEVGVFPDSQRNAIRRSS